MYRVQYIRKCGTRMGKPSRERLLYLPLPYNNYVTMQRDLEPLFTWCEVAPYEVARRPDGRKQWANLTMEGHHARHYMWTTIRHDIERRYGT